ncbi:unnamed protein product [Calypogeia fissa]
MASSRRSWTNFRVAVLLVVLGLLSLTAVSASSDEARETESRSEPRNVERRLNEVFAYREDQEQHTLASTSTSNDHHGHDAATPSSDPNFDEVDDSASHKEHGEGHHAPTPSSPAHPKHHTLSPTSSPSVLQGSTHSTTTLLSNHGLNVATDVVKDTHHTTSNGHLGHDAATPSSDPNVEGVDESASHNHHEGHTPTPSSDAHPGQHTLSPAQSPSGVQGSTHAAPTLVSNHGLNVATDVVKDTHHTSASAMSNDHLGHDAATPSSDPNVEGVDESASHNHHEGHTPTPSSDEHPGHHSLSPAPSHSEVQGSANSATTLLSNHALYVAIDISKLAHPTSTLATPTEHHEHLGVAPSPHDEFEEDEDIGAKENVVGDEVSPTPTGSHQDQGFNEDKETPVSRPRRFGTP